MPARAPSDAWPRIVVLTNLRPERSNQSNLMVLPDTEAMGEHGVEPKKLDDNAKRRTRVKE
jgi:hypothetical protein